MALHGVGCLRIVVSGDVGVRGSHAENRCNADFAGVRDVVASMGGRGGFAMGGGDLSLRVECYAGHRGEEAPRRFYLGARKVEVLEVIDRWLDPRHGYFKVQGDDGAVYILRNDVPTGIWELTLFDGGAGGQGRPSSS